MHLRTVETPGIWFSTICRKNGLSPPDEQVGLMEQYACLLLEWNQKINLVSRKDEDQIWSNHILHCASILFRLRLLPGQRILDLGTGGGLPGIPLKILLPELEFLLLDSTRKKINAVQDIIERLRLEGISTLWGRAEELAGNRNLVSQFDYIVARAVAPLNDLIKWAAPFVRHGIRGHSISSSTRLTVIPPALIALKGGDLDKELADAKRGGLIRGIEVIDLVFHGSEQISSSDKKIVVVNF